MTGRRAVPLLVGLWAASAAAQAPTAYATLSVAIDGGTGFTRAYVVSPMGGQYAVASAGDLIHYYNTINGSEILPAGSGPFGAFAVADQVPAGGSLLSLVAAANIGSTCPTACLDIGFWNPTQNYFTSLTGAVPTNLTSPTAMAIDATSSPVRIFVANSNPPQIYEQDITFAADAGILTGGTQSLAINTGGAVVVGLTYDFNHGLLFLSDSNSKLYTVTNLGTGPLSAGTFGIYSNPGTSPGTGQYSKVGGVFYFSESATDYVLGGGAGSGVYSLTPVAAPNANIVVGSVQVAAFDGRITQPSSASLNALANLTLVTEDPGGAAGFAWVHIVPPANLYWDGGIPVATADAGSDAGTGSGDGGTDAGLPDSGVPTVPVIPPGQGQLTGTVNSCNCSTAGSAPMLLALLLPLFLPRRRR